MKKFDKYRIKNDKKSTRSILKQFEIALSNGGKLNLRNFHLKQLPINLLEIYTIKFDNINWWEKNEIIQINATENEINILDDNVLYLFKDTLKILKLSHNNLTNYNCIHFNQLEILHLSHNKLKTFIGLYPTLMELDLSHNLLSNFNLNDLSTHLISLNLSHNSIHSINMANFPQLKMLNLSFNQLKRINLTENRCLEQVYLNNNQLSQLIGLECLEYVQELHLNNNQLSSIHFKTLFKHLYYLNVSYNQLASLADDFYLHVPQLKVLNLKNNFLSTISNDIIYIQQLTHLDVSNNQLTSLPDSLSFLLKLKFFLCIGNQIRSISMSTLYNSTTKLLQLLRKRLSVEQINELKRKYSSKFIYMEQDQQQQQQQELLYHQIIRSSFNHQILNCNQVGTQINLKLFLKVLGSYNSSTLNIHTINLNNINQITDDNDNDDDDQLLHHPA